MGQVTMISPVLLPGKLTSPAELNVPTPEIVWPVGTHPAPVIDQVNTWALTGLGATPHIRAAKTAKAFFARVANMTPLPAPKDKGDQLTPRIQGWRELWGGESHCR